MRPAPCRVANLDPPPPKQRKAPASLAGDARAELTIGADKLTQVTSTEGAAQ